MKQSTIYIVCMLDTHVPIIAFENIWGARDYAGNDFEIHKVTLNKDNSVISYEYLEELASKNYPLPDDDAYSKRKGFVEGYLKAYEDFVSNKKSK